MQKVIEFTESGIRLLNASRRTHPLGEILLRSGKVDRNQLAKLLEEQKRSKIPLGKLVKDRGLLDEAVIDSALREQVAEEIYDLFTWTDAKFTFEESGDGSPPPCRSISLTSSLNILVAILLMVLMFPIRSHSSASTSWNIRFPFSSRSLTTNAATAKLYPCFTSFLIFRHR